MDRDDLLESAPVRLDDLAEDLLGNPAFNHHALAALFPLCGTVEMKTGENRNHE